MAYLKTEEVAEIRRMLKAALPSWKLSVVRDDNYSGVRIAVMESPVDFAACYVGKANQWYVDDLKNGYAQVNEKFIDEAWSGEALEGLKKINDIAHSQGWYDRSDHMTDYFDVAYYVWLSIGKYDKPYKIVNAKEKKKEALAFDGDALECEAIFAAALVINFIHTQTGETLQVLKVQQLSKDKFLEFGHWMKSEGKGYYSRFAGGFILTTEKNQGVA